MTSSVDWGSLLIGLLALGMGIALLVSPDLAELIFRRNSRARAWDAITGARASPLEPRIIAGFLAVAIGLGLVWVGFHPRA